MESATQHLIGRHGLGSDERLGALSRMTYLSEVTPWMLASDPEAGRLAEELRDNAERECGRVLDEGCADRLFNVLDRIYEGQ